VKPVHLLRTVPHFPAQLLRKTDGTAPPGFTVEQGALRDGAAEHFLQAQGLGAELKLIGAMLFGLAPLILHRVGPPQALAALEADPAVIPVKLHNIALTGDTQGGGLDRHGPNNEKIAPALPAAAVMGSLMHEGAIHGKVIFTPLVFDMD